MVDVKRTRELRLEEVSVVDYEVKGCPIYTVINDPEAERCPKCSYRYIEQKGFLRRHLFDLLPCTALKDGVVELEYLTERFCCTRSECSMKSFQKRVSFVEPRSKFTCRLEIALFERSLTDTFDAIANELNGKISNKTIANTFGHVTEMIDKSAPNVWITPRAMGIHFIELKSEKAFVVINVDEESVIDYLEDCSADTLRLLSKRFKRPDDIETIWVDLYDPLFYAVKEVFPHSKIGIGRYQVQRCMNRLLRETVSQMKSGEKRPRVDTLLKNREDLSRSTLEKVDAFLDRNDDIRKIYQMKEMAHIGSLKDILDRIDELAQDPGFSSHNEFLLKHDVGQYKEVIERSFREAVKSGNELRLSKGYFPYQDDLIGEVLDKTKNCSFEVLRARALYGSNDYGEALELSYRNMEYLRSLESDTTELRKYCRTTFYMRCRMDFSFGPAPQAIGFPLQDVAWRMKSYGSKK